MKHPLHFLPKMVILGMLLLCSFSNSFAQFSLPDSANNLRVPFGITAIGPETFIGVRVQPELAFGKFAVGLDVPLLFNTVDGSFRNQEFQDGISVLRMFRYVRYGQKGRDNVYVRVGDLTGSYLGHGILMNNYTNSPSFERRKVGLTFDVRPKPYFGIEGTYSDFNQFNLLAIRPYVRPLVSTELPILNTLEVGVGYLTDYTPQQIGSDGKLQDTKFVKSGINAASVDASVVVLNTGKIKINAYVQAATIFKSKALADSVDNFRAAFPTVVAGTPLQNGLQPGGGFSIGTNIDFDISPNVFQLTMRLERFQYTDHFMPQFFDAVYEIDKDTKLWALANASATGGTYGALKGTFINKVQIMGGLQVPDNPSVRTPALVFINANANQLIPKLILTATYIKGGLTDLADAFTLNERSLTTARIAYKFTKFLSAGVDYRWTYATIKESGRESFKVTEMIMPYVGLDVPLNFKK